MPNDINNVGNWVAAVLATIVVAVLVGLLLYVVFRFTLARVREAEANGWRKPPRDQPPRTWDRPPT
jgi:hypothetical protein